MPKFLQRSFSGGEVAEEMYGRFDLPHFQTGVALSLNMIVLPHGPLANRPGYGFLKEAKDGGVNKGRLIPFIFNEDQAYAIEFGHYYIRIHTEGGTVVEAGAAVSGATQTNPVVINQTAHGYSNAEEVFLNQIGGMSELNGRYFKIANKTTNTYELQDLQGNSIDGTGYGAYTSGGMAYRVYTLTSPYDSADLFKIKYEQDADVLTLTHPDYETRELQRLGAANWQFTTKTWGPSIAAPTGVSAVRGAGSATGIQHYYAVTAIDQDTLEESLISSESNIQNDLTTAGNYNNISWNVVSGAIRYNVYKRERLSAGTLGFIGQTSGLQLNDDNIAPDFLQTPPENQNPFNGAGEYPNTVTYYEQRRVFGGKENSPVEIHMSRSGTQSNFSRSIPSRDDDAISFALRARRYNSILHLVPISDLIALTTGGEFKITAQNSDAITPSSVWARAQSFVGCNDVRPVVAGGAILFVARRGGHLYDLGYKFDLDRYTPRDISIISPHLVDGYDIVDMDMVTSPYPINYAVRSDGLLLGLTYMPDQTPNIIGWHRHETDGKVESVCAIPESNGETMLYAVVRRKIGGVWRRYIERQHSRRFNTVEDAFFVDSGLSLDRPIAITDASQTNPVVVTAPGHGLSNNDRIRIRDVEGMTELNNRSFNVANAATNTFELQTDTDTPVDVDGTGYTAYESGGTVREEVTEITGLHHLEGKTVSVLADGNVQPRQVVTAGSITLPQKASIIHVGLPYNADVQTLPLYLEGMGDFGVLESKNIQRVFLRVKDSRGFWAGPDFDNLRPHLERTNENWDEYTRLISRRVQLTLSGDFTDHGQVAIRQPDPLPLTITTIGASFHVGSN